MPTSIVRFYTTKSNRSTNRPTDWSDRIKINVNKPVLPVLNYYDFK